ncbi:UNVERIFIED_CONTAM: hypothetical protein HDU68_000865, partial [Siphonaria sp. JEL0065]
MNDLMSEKELEGMSITFALILLVLIDGVLQPLRNYLLGQFVDVLSKGSGNTSTLTINALILSLLTLLVGSIQQTAWSTVLHDVVGIQLRKRTVLSILSSSQTAPTNLAQSLQNIQTSQKIAQEHVPAILQCLVLFLAGLTVAMNTSIKLSLAILLSFPFVAVILSRMWVTARNNDITSNNAVMAASRMAHELLTNVETVLSLNMQDSELARYKSLLLKCLTVQKENGIVNGMGWGTYHCTMFMAFAVAFWVGGSLVNEGVLTSGGVLVCFSQLAVGITALGNIGAHTQALREAEVLLEGVIAPEELKTKEDAVLDRVEGRIEFRDVSFSYPSRPDCLILDSFNLVVEPGSFTAIVAESGAGKSTLFALLLRLYTPTKGKILLDGVDIQSLNPIWLRSQFATIDQQTHLFESLNLYENLTLGIPKDENISMEEIHGALEMAHANGIVDCLPEGLWTIVGGVTDGFSGGQRQRLGVARALLGSEKKRLVLLDEPTSALDAESEVFVQKGLKSISTNKTTLLITHRISILKKDVKMIVVLEKGKVIESGSFEELTAFPSRFKELFDINSKQDTPKSAPLIPSVVSNLANVSHDTPTHEQEEAPSKPLDWSHIFRLSQPQAKWIIVGMIGSLLE